MGIVAQSAFFSRFILQWFASEKAGKVVQPVWFWYFSLVGSLGSLVYSIHLGDPIFITAYALTSLVYVRMVFLGKRS